LLSISCTLPGWAVSDSSVLPSGLVNSRHQQAVRSLNQFQTRGAFAYLSDEQKVYARFFWQQTSVAV
jgi:outer membrane lipoprotein LolB